MMDAAVDQKEKQQYITLNLQGVNSAQEKYIANIEQELERMLDYI